MYGGLGDDLHTRLSVIFRFAAELQFNKCLNQRSGRDTITSDKGTLKGLVAQVE